MNILITICARGGSKGIPGKNIKPLCGLPLIAYAIRAAQKFREAVPGTDWVLSTDSEKIRSVAAEFGLSTPYIRPDYLANDTCGKVDAVKDVVLHMEKQQGKRYDYVLDLDVTSPLRTLQDMLEALKVIEKESGAVVLYTVSEAESNPYFNLVERKPNGFYNLVKDDLQILSRQTAPKVYEQNGSFFWYRRSFFDLGYRSVDTDRSTIYLMPHICFDLDTPLDYDYMAYLIENHKLDFELC